MKLTEKQKKLLWIAAGIFLVIHFAPNILFSVRQAIASRQYSAYAEHAKPPAAHLAMPKAPQPLPSPDAGVSRLMGSWLGEGLLADRGFCRLALELKRGDGLPGSYKGYSTISCGPSLPFSGKKMTAENRAQSLINQMTPTSTILSGSVVNGSIEFDVDQDLGGNPDAPCPVTHFTVTPFGDNNIAVVWKAGTCAGGTMVLKRMASTY
jgi:hypothetical protein